MEYQEFVDRIMNLRRFGKKRGIDVSGELLEAFDRPEKDMKIIHVAGTNGKGSTCTYIANILMKMGFKVGLFTSPHLIDFNERIRIGDSDTFTPISHEDVLEIGQRILDAGISSEPTMFDVCFVMAILKFAKESCDYVVLETGLGGIYDSTNAISCSPKVCLITSIGYDHTRYLGYTISEIASNKAGIIKRGSKVVLSHLPDEARDVITNRCDEIGIVRDDIISCEDYNYRNYNIINNLKTYQRYNAKAATAAINMLVDADRENFIGRYMEYNQMGHEHCGKDCGKCADALKICEMSFDEWVDSYINIGIITMKMAGRLEKMGDNIILDGAHNSEAFTELKNTLTNEYKDYNIHLIMGVLEDKDYAKEIKIIAPKVCEFMTAAIDDERAKSGKELSEEIEKMGYKSGYLGTEEEVAGFLREIMKKDDAKLSSELYNDLYVVCGSLYFVGNIKRLLD